jgi:Zn-dependent peptidase ImmA (M78 family)/DNA-binding XRE family transcriptional regulator
MSTSATAQSIGSAIRSARERLNMSQRVLAQRVGLPAAQSISEIEHGRRAVRTPELVRFSRALHTDVDVLLGIKESPAQPHVLWRRVEGSEHSARDAQLLERARRYAQLEEWTGAEAAAALPMFAFDPRTATEREVISLAAETRKLLDLGSIPAAGLVRTLEEVYGVKIFYEDLAADEGGSAACVRGDFGAAILMNARQAPWRRNFNFAHELFHLVTWDGVEQARKEDGKSARPRWHQKLERFADVFAGHLLLPADALMTRFSARVKDGKITFRGLVELAREFEVSSHALLVRLRELGRFRQAEVDRLRKDDAFKNVDRSTMAELWTAPSTPFPERYRTLAFRAYEEGTIGISKLAQYLEVAVGELVLPEVLSINESQAAIAVA